MATAEDYAAWIVKNADKRGTPDFETVAKAYREAKAAQTTAAPATEPEMGLGDQIKQGAGNLAAGLIRGAGSIGATLLYPIDKAQDLYYGDRGPNVRGLVTGKQPLSRNEERRRAMDEGLAMMGAEPDSVMYKAGKIGGEVAGTAGAGGAVANVLGRAAPALSAANPNMLNAIRTAGMEAGTATGISSPLIRAAGGAVNGAVSAGMVDPESITTGGVIGAVTPGALQVAGKVGSVVGSGIADAADSAAKRLMQSALKPTIAQLKNGDAATAVQTLLDYGINPTKAGVNKLRDLIDQKNAEIAGKISASGATVDKGNVLNALASSRSKFGSQVSPTADLEAIQRVADDFAAHPNFPGSTIPVQAAQEMKQGTYRVLAKKYGQLGSAETEAQKDLARGLKDEIATVVPGIGALNAEESRLLSTLGVAERRALMDANKNPQGLAALASNPMSWAAFMADRSAAFKSLAARIVNSAPGAGNAIRSAVADPLEQLTYRAAPALVADR